MSFKVLKLVYSRTIGSSVKKAILVYFADRASDSGRGIWASKVSISAAIELGRSTTFAAIRELVSDGYLIPVGTRKCQGGETIEYNMNLAAISSLPLSGTQKTSMGTPHIPPIRQPDPSGNQTAPVHQRDPCPSDSGTQTIPETTIEPKDNTKRSALTDEKQAKRATSLPDTWVPSDKNIEDAFAKNFTLEQISEQAAAFRDYHLARGTTFKDWNAGWRTWLGNARRFARSAPARNARPRSAHDVMLAGFQSAALRD